MGSQRVGHDWTTFTSLALSDRYVMILHCDFPLHSPDGWSHWTSFHMLLYFFFAIWISSSVKLWFMYFARFLFFFFAFILFVLAALGLSCGTWDLSLWKICELSSSGAPGSCPPSELSAQTRTGTRGTRTGSTGRWVLSHRATREVPILPVFKLEFVFWCWAFSVC